MATEVRLRRGTSAQHATFTGANGEVTVNTDTHGLVVHDGSTPGGFPVGAPSLATPYTTITSNTAAAVYGRYRIAAALDLTLPSAPADGAWVAFVNHSGTPAARLLRNGQNINGLAEDLTLDVLWAARFVVFRTGYGWFTI